MIEKQLEDFVEEAKEGNKEAFGKLFELTNQKVYYTALKITENSRDAEDMVQEAYVTAFSSLNTLNDNSKFEKWLNRIVANKCRDLVKKRTPDLFSAIDDESDASFEESLESFDLSMIPEQVLDHKALKNIVMQCIDNLPIEQRMCVVMYYYNELSVNEISESIGVPAGTVKSRLSNARKALGKQFESMEKSDNIKLYSASLPIMVALAFRVGGKSCKIPTFSLLKITKNIPNVFFNNGVASFIKTLSFSEIIKRVIFGVGAAAIITGGSMVAREAVVEKRAEIATTSTYVVSQETTKNSNRIFFINNNKKTNNSKPKGKETVVLSAVAISDKENNTYFVNDMGVFFTDKKGRTKKISSHKPYNLYFGDRLMYIYDGVLYQYKNEKLAEYMKIKGEYLYGEKTFLVSISADRNKAYVINKEKKSCKLVDKGGSEYKFLGKMIYYRSSDNKIKRAYFDNKKIKIQSVVSFENKEDMNMPYAVKGNKIYYTSFDSDINGTIYIKDLENGITETITLNGGIMDYSVTKNKIYYSLTTGGLYVYSQDDGVVKLADGDYYCSATNNGNMIWSSTDDSSAYLIRSGSYDMININNGCDIIEFSIVGNTLYYRGDKGYDSVGI